MAYVSQQLDTAASWVGAEEIVPRPLNSTDKVSDLVTHHLTLGAYPRMNDCVHGVAGLGLVGPGRVYPWESIARGRMWGEGIGRCTFAHHREPGRCRQTR